jgi:hypothetical protein
MILNKVKVEGNVITIRSNPTTGIIALTSFVDNVSGEGSGNSFIKSFRYSKMVSYSVNGRILQFQIS